jgi:hypothetical protein
MSSHKLIFSRHGGSARLKTKEEFQIVFPMSVLSPKPSQGEKNRNEICVLQISCSFSFVLGLRLGKEKQFPEVLEEPDSLLVWLLLLITPALAKAPFIWSL